MSQRKTQPMNPSSPIRTLATIGLSVAWYCHAVSLFAADPTPPKPNPAEPVNYLDWINKSFCGVQGKPCAEYKAAAELWKPLQGDLGSTIQGPWSRNDAVGKWLSDNQPALDKFRSASTKPACFFPMDPPKPTADARLDLCLLSAESPDKLMQTVTIFREASKALIAQGYQAWAKSDEKTLPANALTILRTVRHLDTSPLLLRRLVANATAAEAYRVIRSGLSLTEDKAAYAASVMEGLKKDDPPRVSLRRAFIGEQAYMMDICQRLFVPGKNAGTWTIHDPLLKELKDAFDSNDAAELARIGFDETIRELNTYYELLEKWRATPFHRATDLTSELDRTVSQSKNPFIKKVLPTLTRARALDEHCVASRNATYLILQIFLHQKKTKDFPDALDKLQGSDVAQWKIDPLSGKDFIYRKQGDDFILYSASTNMKDDGGKHDGQMKDADFVYWPVPK